MKLRKTITFSATAVLLGSAAAAQSTSGGLHGSVQALIDELNRLITTLGPVAGSVAEQLPTDLQPAEANANAFEGGATGTAADPGTEINAQDLQQNGGIDVPTGAAPSPLFGAEPFTQPLVLFEEFGTRALAPTGPLPAQHPFPSPRSAQEGPRAADLEAFLEQPLSPFPTREANTSDDNPWQPDIERFLGRTLYHPPAEGRPPGPDWAHQRFEEFFPKVYFTTAQAEARENQGLRDQFQLHHYTAGEFGPGGLYHYTTGKPESAGTTQGIQVQLHPKLPVQNENAVWTFDGTLPPKLLMARYGEPILMRHYDALPIDPAANFGFGLHTLSTHEHNGHTPAESDGYTQAFFFPGEYYDYRWPIALAGHDSINTDASDVHAGMPDGHGGIVRIPGDYRETMSTHWFHDHMLDFTAQNVYKGNAAMMNYYSAIDRGNEALEDNVNLRLPSGSALDWGNRDYDVNLVVADKAWDQDGQLFFNIFNLDGFVGDQLTTNWLFKPYLDVRARRYRFRILNGSVSRYLKLALVREVTGAGGELAGPVGSNVSYDRVPFYMIANDGNLMEHSVLFDGSVDENGFAKERGTLPSQGIAERYDIVVDFAQFAPDTKLYFVNLLEHQNGRRPNREVPLAEVLDGRYAPRVENGRNVTDSAVTRFLELRVKPYGGQDLSVDPAVFLPGGRTMIPRPVFSAEDLASAVHRTFVFKRAAATDAAPWTVTTDGGPAFKMDPRRLSAAVTKTHAEIWHIQGNGGWSHPVHVHFEEGQILLRGGKPPPEWERFARKDVYRVGPFDDTTESLDVVVRFREFLGSYMEHCHNTQHEDHSMLLRWDSESPNQVRVMPTPMPSWEGVGFVPSFALPTFRSGDVAAAQAARGSGGPGSEPTP